MEGIGAAWGAVRLHVPHEAGVQRDQNVLPGRAARQCARDRVKGAWLGLGLSAWVLVRWPPCSLKFDQVLGEFQFRNELMIRLAGLYASRCVASVYVQPA